MSSSTTSITRRISDTTTTQLLKAANAKNSDSLEEQQKLLKELEETFDYEGRVSVPSPDFRSGYVSVIGAPNMGKSTLVNALLQEKLCIATRRPQTTRHAILGILTTRTCQLCLLDTPGIIDQPAYKLQEGMMEAVQGAFQDADVLLIVTDLFSTPIPNDDLFLKVQQQQGKRPIIVVINKIDLANNVNIEKIRNEERRKKESETENAENPLKTVTVPEAVARWRQLLPEALAIIPTSASEGPDDVGVTCLRRLLLGGPDVPAAIRDLGRPVPGMFLPAVKLISDEEAQALLPPGPPLYQEEMFTDRTERFLASEMIRAALLETFQKELPYCCEVLVTSFKEKPKDNPTLIAMDATICVERDSQKIIVVGKQGSKIKEVGIKAREALEEFFQTKVFLKLQVKVDKDWRKKEDRLKQYGYKK